MKKQKWSSVQKMGLLNILKEEKRILKMEKVLMDKFGVELNLEIDLLYGVFFNLIGVPEDVDENSSYRDYYSHSHLFDKMTPQDYLNYMINESENNFPCTNIE